MINKIPAGTRFFLTKKKSYNLCIQPDKILPNDSLYVAYDIRVNGVMVIPKGTRVTGDWITESNPLSAQFQMNKIFLQGSGQKISGDSDVIETITDYNNDEVCHADHLYRQKLYSSISNIPRRIVKLGVNSPEMAYHYVGIDSDKQQKYNQMDKNIIFDNRSIENTNQYHVYPGCCVKKLLDNNRNVIFLEIFTKEIPMTLTEDFTLTICYRE